MNREVLEYENPIRERLEPEETVRWVGKPRAGILLRGSDALMIPFSILWGGFAIFWEAMALRGTAKASVGIKIIFPLWGVPFVLVGLYMMVGRFFADAYVRGRTWYGVTDRRAIIVSGLMSQTTTSVSLATLSAVSLTEHRDGTGTVRLGQAVMVGNGYARGWPAGRFGGGGEGGSPATFDHIFDAAEVYRLILECQNKAGLGLGMGR
jgi:hypothetical protein